MELSLQTADSQPTANILKLIIVLLYFLKLNKQVFAVCPFTIHSQINHLYEERFSKNFRPHLNQKSTANICLSCNLTYFLDNVMACFLHFFLGYFVIFRYVVVIYSILCE